MIHLKDKLPVLKKALDRYREYNHKELALKQELLIKEIEMAVQAEALKEVKPEEKKADGGKKGNVQSKSE
jgi:hypothetical protein